VRENRTYWFGQVLDIAGSREPHVLEQPQVAKMPGHEPVEVPSDDVAMGASGPAVGNGS
jgi:hypothetical protein